MTTATYQAPFGALTLVADGDALVAVHLDGDPAAPPPRGVLARVARQLDEYFARTRTAFELPLAAPGTDFQRAVWAALVAIPFGETRSYVDIARAVGRPTASRAVGAANGQNPIAIIVPCHRVIGASGALTGYAGGLERKRWLLAHEGALLL
ncbi:MAG: methylated-DNA--[protein]-cysteine S-methyltransferase [Deltaproteobacteria bacterium]|nr:methylated-DNA--[protein]-cysteine S-methyltransferase [Deltaproteobacteria bacterium]